MKMIERNALSIAKEIQWFEAVVDRCLDRYFSGLEYSPASIFIEPPDLSSDHSNYASIVSYYDMGFQERVILILTLIPHVKPQVLDIFFTRNTSYDKTFTEFGGIRGNVHSGFLPTAETAAFLLAGNNMKLRFSIQYLLDEAHAFRKHNIIILQSESESEPFFSRPLRMSKEYLSYLTSGEVYKPDFSSSFPASLLATRMNWPDLVLDQEVLEEVEEINTWVKYGQQLLSTGDLGKKLKRGYRALFYGPPGTGKTLTASLLGKSNYLDVYRIDLSMIVSKYIGETEKNLANVFDQAENKNWILFFDEADALFGKRTATKDSKDRYANQEISYLLQRVEDYPGLVILATNLKGNIDDAFARRFQSMIYFPMPSPEMRYELWRKAFGGEFLLDESVNLQEISREYELAGGAITNVLRYCGLKALTRESRCILLEDILTGIRKEFMKEGKTI